MQVLDLAYTQLLELPTYLLHTPQHLKVLNLTGNQMSRVPPALSFSHALEELHFSDNPISVLSEEK